MNKKRRNTLRAIFIKHDPMEIYFETNFDEYDPEIDLLVRSFRKTMSSHEFLNEVHRFFILMFDKRVAGPKSKYKVLAKEVYDCLYKDCN